MSPLRSLGSKADSGKEPASPGGTGSQEGETTALAGEGLSRRSTSTGVMSWARS